jgi:transposase
VLIECAWAAARSRDTYLSAQYWRLARRIGNKKAAQLQALGYHVVLEPRGGLTPGIHVSG